ncbi:MAG: hypothetical protein ACYCU0_08310 [Solirubrobacteraceae bacterium]
MATGQLHASTRAGHGAIPAAAGRRRVAAKLVGGEPRYLHDLLGAHRIDIGHEETAQLDVQAPDVESAAHFLIETAGHVAAERERLMSEGRWHELTEAVIRIAAR